MITKKRFFLACFGKYLWQMCNYLLLFGCLSSTPYPITMVQPMFESDCSSERKKPLCVCVCARACTRACVCVCMHTCLCKRERKRHRKGGRRETKSGREGVKPAWACVI